MSNLALDLRPQSLDQIIGQDAAKKAIQSFADKDNWPNVFLFYGPPGTGKTTLAQIVAKLAGADESCTHEINASGENGVDSARELAEMSASQPFTGKRRVIILNEFHQFTGPAQEVLKDPMEKNPAIWIITTDRPDKVSPAIKSRAAAATFELKPLSRPLIQHLVVKAMPGEKALPLAVKLDKLGVNSPREILGILDQMIAGIPLEEAVHGSEHEPLYKDVAGAVLNGNWTKAAAALAQIKTADARGLIGITSAFFRNELVKCPMGPRADALSACLVGMDQTGFQDGVAYGAVAALLYKCCRALTKETK